MPLTDAEYRFLDAYVYEVYTPSMRGPHTHSLLALGANQTDLSWLLTAYHQQALAEDRSPLGRHSPERLPPPWSTREEILARGRKLRQELERQAEPAQPVSG